MFLIMITFGPMFFSTKKVCINLRQYMATVMLKYNKYQKMVSVKLLVVVIIVFKRCPSTY